MRSLVKFATVGLLSFASAALCGQEKLEVDPPRPGVLRLGETSQVMIRIEGREAAPRTPVPPRVDGLRFSVGPPARSSYTYFDGRTTVERSGVQYTLEIRPERVGSFVIPPFPVWTGSKEQSTPELRLEVKTDLVGKELGWIEVTVEPRKVYVHEPIRLRVDYGVQQGVRLVQGVYDRYRYLDVEVQAPWLTSFPGGEPIETPKPRGAETTPCVLNNQLLLDAEFDPSFAKGGQRWQRFTFTRSFLPTRLGRIELPAPMLRFHVLQREGPRDVFGRSRSVTENYFVGGEPVAIEVLPIPEAGRPSPFYGAVGRFTIDARLDRDRLRVGESVKLTLTVRGKGNCEFLRLPDLDALPGFHSLGQAEVQRSADSVAMTYDLTPLSDAVDAVPPIGWNYFDTTPGVEKFVSVETPRLGLTVDPLPAGEVLAPMPGAAPKAVVPGVDDIFDLPDLDGPPQRALRPATWWLLPTAAGPWALVLGVAAWLGRRRRQRADVAGRREREARRTCERALAAGAAPLDALAGYLGDRMGVAAAAVIAPDLAARLAAAGLETAVIAEVCAAIERGTAARYGGGGQLDVDEVRRLVTRIDPVALRRPSSPPSRLVAWFLLPVLAFAGTAPAVAQDRSIDEREAAVTAYRAGDYPAAAAAFERLFAASGDRRLLRAVGNCRFRQGDLSRALLAYERARLGLRRDPELLADLRLVRGALDLPAEEPDFVATLAALTDRLDPLEQVAAAGLAMLLSAALWVVGRRRGALRWLSVLAAVPAVWLLVHLGWAAGAPARAVVLTEARVTSEPRADLPPIATVRPGVVVELLGGSDGSFVRVTAGSKVGYLPRASVGTID